MTIEAKRAWKQMVNRCCDPKRSGTAIVWPSYREFKIWHDQNYVPGWELDKDLLVPGNTEYGPDTCRYIPASLNAMQPYNIMDIKYAAIHYGGYRARVRWLGKSVTIGKFNTEADAVYWMRRSKIKWVFESIPKYRSMGAREEILDAVEKKMRAFAGTIGRARQG